jgi:hypothetical protein
MRHQKEKPRLTVLQNFKEINRIMTNTFMKKKNLESKYKKGVPADVLAKTENEEKIASQMTLIMKKMQSPRNFCEPMRKFGTAANYQNVNLARSIMLDNHKVSLRTTSCNSGGLVKNMGSLYNTSSQFDKNA